MSLCDPMRARIDELADAIKGGDETAIRDACADLRLEASTIDREHAIRMEQCRRGTVHAMMRYLRGILNDYDKGIKRMRPSKVVPEIDWTSTFADGTKETGYRCPHCGAEMKVEYLYCHGCGGKVVWREKR